MRLYRYYVFLYEMNDISVYGSYRASNKQKLAETLAIKQYNHMCIRDDEDGEYRAALIATYKWDVVSERTFRKYLKDENLIIGRDVIIV